MASSQIPSKSGKGIRDSAKRFFRKKKQVLSSQLGSDSGAIPQQLSGRPSSPADQPLQRYSATYDLNLNSNHELRPSTSASNPTQSDSIQPSTAFHLLSETPTSVQSHRVKGEGHKEHPQLGLESALKVLHTAAGVFAPLQSAVDAIISCFKLIPTMEGHRRHYDNLALELDSLARIIQTHRPELELTSMSDCMANIVSEIQEEVASIRTKLQERVPVRILEMNNSEDDIAHIYHRFEVLFRQLQTNISLSTWGVAYNQLVNTRLEGLIPAKLASYNSTLSTEIYRRTCTENTRTAVLSGLHEWLYDPDAAKIYWMNGMAGTGKTTIACTLSEALAGRKLLGASFFCTQTSPECRASKRIIPTIAYQMARYSRPFQSALFRTLENDPDIGTREISLQFQRLLQEPLLEVRSSLPRNIVVVIDALDECNDTNGVRALLKSILKNASGLPLKIFITSRPEPEIYDGILHSKASARSVLHLHEIERSLVQADIELYLAEELSFMEPSHKQIKQLARQAGNLFIYAATAVRYIKSGTKSINSQARLNTVLTTKSKSIKQYAELDALYLAILDAALDEEVLEVSESNCVRLVLWGAISAREPVTPQTLARLADVGDQEALTVLKSLRSVLYISEHSGLVSTLHASFPDFIFNLERSGKYHCERETHEHFVSNNCFKLMQNELRFNICHLESSFVLDKDINDLEGCIQRQIPKELSYVCRYWGEHLSITTLTKELCNMLDFFLSNQLLFWMEVLNLTGSMATGLSALQRARSWLAVHQATDRLIELIEDAQSFATAFSASPASLSTPHIYISSLPLCPKSSSVYANYWSRTSGLLRASGTALEQRQLAPLATWHTGAMVFCMSLSPDGNLIAFGSDLGRVGVIKSLTGEYLVEPFNGHSDMVNSVKFSPEGAQFVSGSADKTICIWNTQDGSLSSGPFIGHSDWVTAVAFSPDGAFVISGSRDCTIRVWDIQTESEAYHPLRGHTGFVTSVDLSPDGACIVSGSSDFTIRIWNSRNGTLMTEPLSGHVGFVNQVAVSPDGNYIMSSSADLSLRLWDTRNGTLANILQCDSISITSLAFSPDGSLIVTGSAHGTIYIWDIHTGELTAGPFERHSSAVHSVAFSTDKTLIFSGSRDCTIAMWSVKGGLSITAPFEGHTDCINSVAFSPAGTSIASGSDDQTIRVWDAQNGSLTLGPLREHTAAVNSVAFSPDGLYIASGSEDRTIVLWSAKPDAPSSWHFIGHTGPVLSVSFSPDGSRIVSASEDRSVRSWGTQHNETSAAILLGHTGSVTSAVFSPDGNMIASCSADGTIRLWSAHEALSLGCLNANHADPLNSVAFSPSGDYVASGSEDCTICVWDVSSHSLVLGPLLGHEGPVYSLKYTSEGSRIISGSDDQNIIVWDAHSGMITAGPFKGHANFITSVSPSPDDTLVASSSQDLTIRVVYTQGLNSEELALCGDWDISESGWVVNEHGQYLFWVPLEIRSLLPYIYNTLVVGPLGAIRLDYRSLLIGSHWHQCFT